MEFIQAQVLAVTGKSTAKGIVYEVQMGNGTTYSTWDDAMAAKANALTGQVADAHVETTTKPNPRGGVYTNHKLSDIAPQGGLGAVAAPVAAGTPIPVAAPAVAAPANGAAPAPIQMQTPGYGSDEIQRFIIRQNVLGTAYAFVGQMYEGAGPESLEAAEAAADALASKLYKKVLATPEVEAQPVALPANATPTDVAEAVNAAAETGAQVAVGAAPEPEW